ncbi:MAG: hypothetical protein HY517_03650 [Candidatus Aenigmarchaeota archaeon]|nr:hypothetical protein [Candidatus Aenigmarchaeota archaeon]
MLVKRGTFYTCSVCKCELVAVKSPVKCPFGDCQLSCCGKRMKAAR